MAHNEQKQSKSSQEMTQNRISRQEHQDSYYNCISCLQEKKRKIMLTRDMKDIF